MAIHGPGGEPMWLKDSANGDDQGHYTGVVLIHGIGDEKRNDTLQEAVNALIYWFTNVARLAYRPEGTGRVWLQTDLTVDDDPDAESSSATLELVPPSALTAKYGSAPTLRLHWREVWWAQAFGLPSLGAVLHWARIQYREERTEETRRLWLALTRRLGLRKPNAHSSPHGRVPASTVQSSGVASGHTESQATGSVTPEASGAQPGAGMRLWLALLPSVLWFYGTLQYVWKLMQWLLLMPLIYVLLGLLRIARIFSFVPFVRSTVVGSLTGLVDYVSLHWIAPLQVYLVDYVRSSAIRQLFERDLDQFLTDPRCDHVVVVAHSMGTVVAYEGLTTALPRASARGNYKPVTFITLGQALRRMWLLSGNDQHRLRSPLPRGVRWVNFWARYDPVAAGPLSRRSIPPLESWLDPDRPDPHEQICAVLEGCENVSVVNRDSLFSDHASYWGNMEQVVGPIARELVAGHAALAQLVEARQTSRQDVLLRRWRVAWPFMVAAVLSLASSGILLALDAINGGKIGQQIGSVAQAIVKSKAVQRLVSTLSGGLTDAFAPLLTAFENKAGPVGQGILSLLRALSINPAYLVTLVSGLAVIVVVFLLVTRMFAMPVPGAFRMPVPRGSTWSVFRLWVISVVAFLGIYVLALPYISATQLPTLVGVALIVDLIVWGLCALAVWLVSLADTSRRRRWGWFAIILLAPAALILPPVLTGGSALSALSWGAAGTIGFFVTCAGWIMVLSDVVRSRRWGWLAGMIFALPIVLLGGLSLVLAPACLYGLWAGPGTLRAQHTAGDARDAVLRVSGVSLILLFAYYGLASGVSDFGEPAVAIWLAALVALGTALAVAPWLLGMIDAVRSHRWGWLAALVVLGALLTFMSAAIIHFAFFSPSNCPDSGCSTVSGALAPVYTAIADIVWPGLLMAALIYGLWAGPARTPRRDARSLPRQAEMTVAQPVGVPTRAWRSQ